MAKNDFYNDTPPNYNYPVVIGPCRVKHIYGAMPWPEVLAAARAKRDGLRIVSGFEMLSDIRMDECAWREISTLTWGKVTGLLFQNTGDVR